MSGLRSMNRKLLSRAVGRSLTIVDITGDVKMKNTSLIVIEQIATQINGCHKEIREHGLSMVQVAIKAGALLLEQKQKVGHGNWLGWVEGNLIFGGRTAQVYIQCYKNRDELNTQSSAHLGKAVSLLASGAASVQSDQKKLESSISEERDASTKSQGAVTVRTVASLAPKACCTPKLAEWHPVEHLQVSGWYGGLASNKVRDRCRELQSKFVSLHLEMTNFFRNDANASKEKLSQEDWKRVHEETECFAAWLYSASQEMGKAAGVIKIEKGDITLG